jgi:hypothetical protein
MASRRMPEMPHAAAFTLAPDWVCEVLSPSTTKLDRAEKLPVYARRGVGHVWLVDPLEQYLESCGWTATPTASSRRTLRTRRCARSPSTRSSWI